MLSEPEKPEFDHPASIIYYRVMNMQETVAVLKSRGAVFESEPHLIAKMPNHDLWMAFLRDPERNLIGLMSEVARR
jgi:predicted enzyme related to lactoylglutathione lyase